MARWLPSFMHRLYTVASVKRCITSHPSGEQGTGLFKNFTPISREEHLKQIEQQDQQFDELDEVRQEQAAVQEADRLERKRKMACEQKRRQRERKRKAVSVIINNGCRSHLFGYCRTPLAVNQTLHPRQQTRQGQGMLRSSLDPSVISRVYRCRCCLFCRRPAFLPGYLQRQDVAKCP